MKVSMGLVGNYMCKNPPLIYIDVARISQQNQPQTRKYVFNTPPDIQRNLQSQYVRLNGQQTIMFTKFSHQTLSGLTCLVLMVYENLNKKRLVNFKLYGTPKHFQYFQMAKFHLGQKVFGLSYSAWTREKAYRLGIICEDLYLNFLSSEKFANYIWKINWKLQKQDKDKINDCRLYLKEQARAYEDQNVQIRPFMQKSPFRTNEDHYDSVTNFLCIFKSESQRGQSNEVSSQQNQYVTRKATLIMTYKSLQQIQLLLQGKDCIQGLNSSLGLLQYLCQHSSSLDISTMIHIIQDPCIIFSTQFHTLFNRLQQVVTPTQESSKERTRINLFYGYGIKSQTTNVHHLMNTYYKGIRFYSIVAKLFKYVPNITLNHYSYWAKIFDEQFVDVAKVLQHKMSGSSHMNNGSGQRMFIEAYKPIHRVIISAGQDGSLSQLQPNKTDQSVSPYVIPPQLLSSLKYPLFSNSLQYRPTSQLIQTFKKKCSYQSYHQTPISNKSRTRFTTFTPMQKLFKEFDPKVIFLGTSSKTPSYLRNVSGILIQIEENMLILMDCGAGTYQQFLYHYPVQKLNQKLLGLKVIFMSHLHADHNLGVLDLISRRNRLIKQMNSQNKQIISQEKLFLILPFNMINWIHFYCKSVQNILQNCHILFTQTLCGQKINVRDQFFQTKRKQNSHKIQRNKISLGRMFTPCNSTRNNGTKREQQQQDNRESHSYEKDVFVNKYLRRDVSLQDHVKTLNEQDSSTTTEMIQKYGYKQEFILHQFNSMLLKAKLRKFLPSKVFHCPQSYGLIIEHKNGLKVSYSGDCRPTPEFLQHAKKSTLLIHQATYQTDQNLKALSKLHSTFHQALQAGLESESTNICLTHFTPGAFDRDLAQACHRQLYKPQVLEYYKNSAIVACDHLQFRLSEMQQVSKVSKIIASIGNNSISQKNYDPFSLATIIRERKADEVN